MLSGLARNGQDYEAFIPGTGSRHLFHAPRVVRFQQSDSCLRAAHGQATPSPRTVGDQ